MTKVRRVPWKNRFEWLEVYNMLQNSNDLAETEKAAQHMELWIERGHCPPAVEYTCRFIKPICRDPYFFSSQSNSESGTNLQVQYATSILRFINILGEVESEKSLSLNARALKIGLPEWVVNTRHQISHGSCLPSLDLLRISVDSLLKWLKVNYWEVEKHAMKDLILPDTAFLFKDKFSQLLDIYVHLHEVSSKNTKLVGAINSQDIKEKVLKLGQLQYQLFRQEIRTWETTVMPSVSSVYEPTQLVKITILTTIQLVVRTIKPYFEHETANATEIFVCFLLQDGVDEDIDTRIKRWQPLLAALHAKGRFPILLNRMVDYACNEQSEYHKHAAGWTILLLKSLLKRYKAQKNLTSYHAIVFHLQNESSYILLKNRKPCSQRTQ
uniref:LAS1-like protein n=2 Tax=Lygus hesperus TaxID=30085 RepID=A0A0A9YI34_LYGHE